MFLRELESEMGCWHAGKNRKPLVIRGARQVGKSTLVREFAKHQGIPLFEVNLERHSRLDAAFATLDIANILRELEFVCGKGPLDKGLIFLDEIQAAPQALRALRYFYEERPDLAVVAAGSLLEFALEELSAAMPVGRIRYLHVHPLTFSEFVTAVGLADLGGLLATWEAGAPFPAAAHERLLAALRDYLLVGGMPEAVAAFAESGSLQACAEVHHSILETYRDDFGKYGTKAQIGRLRRLLDFVPLAVGDKFRYARAIPDNTAKEVRQALDLLAMAGLVHLVRHSAANGLPLGAEADDAVFKPLFLDIGLMNAACGIRSLSMETLREGRFVNEGKMAEQFVGQQLLAGGDPGCRPALHYWLREGRNANAEVDYLMEAGGTILPVEVKAGASGTLKSLHQFAALKNIPLAIRFDLNTPAEQAVSFAALTTHGTKPANYSLLSLPLYLASQAGRIAGQRLKQQPTK